MKMTYHCCKCCLNMFHSIYGPTFKAVVLILTPLGTSRFFESHPHFLSSGWIPSSPKRTRQVRNERKMGNSWSFSLFPGSSSPPPPSRLGVKVYLILIKHTCSSSSAGIKGAPHCRVLCGCTETSCSECFKLEQLRIAESFDCLQSCWVSYKPTNSLFIFRYLLVSKQIKHSR